MLKLDKAKVSFVTITVFPIERTFGFAILMFSGYIIMRIILLKLLLLPSTFFTPRLVLLGERRESLSCYKSPGESSLTFSLLLESAIFA